jgi:hypothetical protein
MKFIPVIVVVGGLSSVFATPVRPLQVAPGGPHPGLSGPVGLFPRPYPIPHFPIPKPHFPIPESHFPIPKPRIPIPKLRLPKRNFEDSNEIKDTLSERSPKFRIPNLLHSGGGGPMWTGSTCRTPAPIRNWSSLCDHRKFHISGISLVASHPGGGVSPLMGPLGKIWSSLCSHLLNFRLFISLIAANLNPGGEAPSPMGPAIFRVHQLVENC